MVKVKIKKNAFFWTGICIFLFLLASYFIKIPVDSGFNFVVNDSLLGIIILHNPFVFAFYILILIVLLAKAVKVK